MADKNETLLEQAQRSKVSNEEYLAHWREQRKAAVASGRADALAAIDGIMSNIESLVRLDDEVIEREKQKRSVG